MLERLRVAVLLGAFAIATAPALSIRAQDGMDAAANEYRQHMENGVKLYQDRNYQAAIVEFEAAYKVRPKASPLVNISLCYKGMFKYAKAIVALETALEKHADTMSDADKKAASDAIAEMRALLGYVRIQVTPKNAIVSVDGEDQPVEALAKPLALSPGIHEIEARAEGHSTESKTVKIASGDKDVVVELKLVPEQGWVVIRAHDRATAIVVDGQHKGYGAWQGYMRPGTYRVYMYGADQKPRYAAEFDVTASDQAIEIRPGFGGRPIPEGPVGPPFAPPPPGPPKPTPPKSGAYVLATGAIVGPLWHPEPFDRSRPEGETGGVIGGRIGYRVNDLAAFELMIEHGNVTVESESDEQSNYSLSSTRLGANLRLMTPGERFRVIGILGGGFVYDDLEYEVGGDVKDACKGECTATSGFDPYVLAEAGVELDLRNVLLGATFVGYFQATKDLNDKAYGNDPLVSLGGRMHVGYAFW